VAIFFLSSSTSAESMSRLPVRLFSDLGALVSRPLTLIVAVLFVAGAGTVIAFFPRDGELAARAEQAAAAATPLSSDAQKAFADAWSKQVRTDLGIKADGAKIIIVKFNDFVCGACAQAEMVYKPVLQKFQAAHPGAVKYVMKDWPWNKGCNFNISSTIPGHEAACDAAVVARVARDRGKYDQMVDWLFAHQEVSATVMRQEAAKILGPLDFDKEYAAKIGDVRRDIADGGVLGIQSTPTFFINGVKLPPGIMPVQYFEMALNLELNRP
jgi:protein-disulfide isomerase